MTLDLASLPLAAAAGALGILSPCVWPLVPVVMSSAAAAGRSGPWWLAGRLSVSFALAGTLLSALLVSAGIDPGVFRTLSAALLVAAGLVLLSGPLSERVALVLSRFTGGIGSGATGATTSFGQLGVGALLGLVWLPCVGPTLGAAMALAALGRDLGMVFLAMTSFGLGTALALLVASRASMRLLARVRPRIGAATGLGKRALGWTLLVLGLLVLTGLDKALETRAVGSLPAWALSL